MTPLQAIKAKCLDCCCGDSSEVKKCPATKCPLYPFKGGKNSAKQKRELSEEQRAAKRDILANARESKKTKKRGFTNDNS